MKAETKAVGHTPGPWRVVDEDHDYSVKWNDEYVGVSVIRTTDTDSLLDVCLVPDDSEEAKANQTLIAAAPDLLAAAEAALDAISAVDSASQGHRLDSVLEAAIQSLWHEQARLETAIRKARTP